jgi:hypothetical protein
MNEDYARKTAKALDIVITRGTLKPRMACTEARATQKRFLKDNVHEVAVGTKRRVFLDLSTIKKTDKDGKPQVIYNGNWMMLVDEQSQLKFSEFYKTKDAMMQPTCEQLHRWKQAGNKPVTYMRMDNAGENKKLEVAMNSKDWKLNIEPKYMAQNMPQQNHLAELSLASAANKSRAMMIAAHVPEDQVYHVVKEAIRCTTHVDGLVVMTLDGKMDTRMFISGT